MHRLFCKSAPCILLRSVMHYALYILHTRDTLERAQFYFTVKSSLLLCGNNSLRRRNEKEGSGGSLMWDPPSSKKVIELKNMEKVFQLIPYESQVERWGL